jgi:protein gp37
MSVVWNPWHGCNKFSDGCKNCYVYRMDASHGREGSTIAKTGDYMMPLRRKRDGDWKIPAGTLVYTCFTSDFFLEDADEWRQAAWQAMKTRDDLHYLLITKRIHRLHLCLPEDWGNGYPHVTICCTMENQAAADARLPIFCAAPIVHKRIICEPLLGPVNLTEWLGPWVEEVLAGGESGPQARPCRWEWVTSLREQCQNSGVAFVFRQTGANFVKDGKTYRIPRKDQHEQARKAGIDLPGKLSINR